MSLPGQGVPAGGQNRPGKASGRPQGLRSASRPGNRPASRGAGGLPVLRPARWRDAARLRDWRNRPDTRVWMSSPAPVTWPEHLRWLWRMRRDRDRRLYVAWQDGGPVGTGHLDHRTGVVWISVTVAPDARRQGLATPIIEALVSAAKAEFKAYLLLAAIKKENTASRKAFEKAGFSEQSEYLRRLFGLQDETIYGRKGRAS